MTDEQIMTDEQKEIVEQVTKEIIEQAQTDSPKEIVEKSDNKVETNEDIFISEKDTFDVKIEFYRDENNKLVVQTTDDDGYDPVNKTVRSFTATFKYPSQSDLEAIMNSKVYKSPEKLEVSDIITLELIRIAILIRKWSLNQKINRITELDPKIVKGLVNKVRDVIGMDGIV